VLVVDDSALVGRIAASALETRGHQVAIVPSGRLALQHLREHECDVVLMDLQMPQMDGFTTTRLLRLHHDLPVVALTAGSTAEDWRHCLAAGMNDYLPKLFGASQLLATVERWGALGWAASPAARRGTGAACDGPGR
jgi:CheY-like chemotaxis protein